MNHLTKGHILADVSAIIATLDIVFGSVDRRSQWTPNPSSPALEQQRPLAWPAASRAILIEGPAPHICSRGGPALCLRGGG
jgi:hypothetical protein